MLMQTMKYWQVERRNMECWNNEKCDSGMRNRVRKSSELRFASRALICFPSSKIVASRLKKVSQPFRFDRFKFSVGLPHESS